MPDYFLALVKQYARALNDEQAERYATAVVRAWYVCLNPENQQKLAGLLPGYLPLPRQMFFTRRGQTVAGDQSQVIIERLQCELSKTDAVEVRAVIEGVYKSLKIISAQPQKFAYSCLLTGELQQLFIKA